MKKSVCPSRTMSRSSKQIPQKAISEGTETVWACSFFHIWHHFQANLNLEYMYARKRKSGRKRGGKKHRAPYYNCQRGCPTKLNRGIARDTRKSWPCAQSHNRKFLSHLFNALQLFKSIHPDHPKKGFKNHRMVDQSLPKKVITSGADQKYWQNYHM